LEKGVNFGEGYKATKGRDVSRFGLEKEEEIGILLDFAVVRIVAFCRIDLLKSSLDFTELTRGESVNPKRREKIVAGMGHFVQCHPVLNQ